MTKRHRSRSIAKKREVVDACLNGEELRTPSQRHDACRSLIRIWIAKYERGAYDDDAAEAGPPSETVAAPPRCRSTKPYHERARRHGLERASGRQRSRVAGYGSRSPQEGGFPL
ncbi:MAG: hypothetical protein F4Z55_03055 [Boseongicola sp. SB0667_bin_21]|nr:hypothetical protein [Boseongicola sp. SB0667_bin_21]